MESGRREDVLYVVKSGLISQSFLPAHMSTQVPKLYATWSWSSVETFRDMAGLYCDSGFEVRPNFEFTRPVSYDTMTQL